MVDAEGKSETGFCFGHSDFARHYRETVAPNCRRFGFEMHCLDFLTLYPCYAAGHGHPPGTDSLYPKNPELGCRYADLVGSAAQEGDNTLLVYLEY
jgi:hypothetical protein